METVDPRPLTFTICHPDDKPQRPAGPGGLIRQSDPAGDPNTTQTGQTWPDIDPMSDQSHYSPCIEPTTFPSPFRKWCIMPGKWLLILFGIVLGRLHGLVVKPLFFIRWIIWRLALQKFFAIRQVSGSHSAFGELVVACSYFPMYIVIVILHTRNQLYLAIICAFLAGG